MKLSNKEKEFVFELLAKAGIFGCGMCVGFLIAILIFVNT